MADSPKRILLCEQRGYIVFSSAVQISLFPQGLQFGSQSVVISDIEQVLTAMKYAFPHFL